MNANVDNITHNSLQSVLVKLQEPIRSNYVQNVCEGDGFLDSSIHSPDKALRDAFSDGIFEEFRRKRDDADDDYDPQSTPDDDEGTPDDADVRSDFQSRGENYFVYWLMRQVSAQFGTCESNYKGPQTPWAEYSTEASFANDAKGMTPLIHNVDLFKLYEVDDRVRYAQGKEEHRRGDVDDHVQMNGTYVERPQDLDMKRPYNPTLSRKIYTNVENQAYDKATPLLPWIHEEIFKILRQCYPPRPDLMKIIFGENEVTTLNPVRVEERGSQTIAYNEIVRNTQNAYSRSFGDAVDDERHALARNVRDEVAVRHKTETRTFETLHKYIKKDVAVPLPVYAPLQCVVQRVFNFTRNEPYVAFISDGLSNNLTVYYNYLREFIRAEMCVRYIFILQLIDRASRRTEFSTYPGLSYGFKLAREVRQCIESVLAMNWQDNDMFDGPNSWVIANQRVTRCNPEQAQRRVLCFIIWRNLWHFNELYKDRYGENIVDTVSKITVRHYITDSNDENDDNVPIYLYKNIIFGYNRAVSLMCYDHYMKNFEELLDIRITVGDRIDFRGSDFGVDKTAKWQVENFFTSLKVQTHEYVYVNNKRQRISRIDYKQPFMVLFDEYVSTIFKKHVRGYRWGLKGIKDLEQDPTNVIHEFMGNYDFTTQLSKLLLKNWLVRIPRGHRVTLEDLMDHWEDDDL